MAQSTLAGVITACASVLTALGLLITALTVLIPLLKSNRDIHKIVNQQRTDMLKYQRALKNALKAAGIDVPEDQSIDLDK